MRFQSLMRRGFATALLAGAAVCGPSATDARPLDDVVSSGVLRVSVYSDNKPFSVEQDGKRSGIDVELAEAIAKKLNVKLDLRIVEASDSVDGDFRLNLWKGDLVGTPLADLMLQVPNDRQLALRNEQIFLTAPYFEQHIAFAYHKGDMEGLESLNDVEGHPIAAETGSASDMLVQLAEGGRFRSNVKHYRNFDEAVAAYLAKETPVLTGTKAEIQAALRGGKVLLEDNPIVEVKVTGMVKNSWELAGATRSDSRDLAYAVGTAMTDLIKSGDLKAICARYGVDFAPPKAE
jgi:polar amino acid transport system substrate-binding protein